MYINHLYKLRPGDKVTYTDLNGRDRELIFVRDTGFVNCVKDRQPTLQQQFIDEIGRFIHIPIGAWEFTKIQPCRHIV